MFYDYVFYAVYFICGAGGTYFGLRSAYRNGVTDGYGYAKEPRNYGYAEAGRYLRKYMAHRWSDLRKEDDE